MILRAYSIYDTKTLVFHPPWFAHTHGAATRIVADLANDTNTSIGRHPADYILYCLGDYDDQRGLLRSADIREHICDVVSLVDRPAELFPVAAQ